MRNLVLGLAAAAVVGIAVPASAQVTVRTGTDGVAVRVGERHHNRHWRDAHNECRVVRTKSYRPNGTVVIKTRRMCN
jgi:hypothetical protein